MISSNPCLRDVFSVHVGKGIVGFGKDIEINEINEINDADFELLNLGINKAETLKNGETSGMNDETLVTESDAVDKGKLPE